MTQIHVYVQFIYEGRVCIMIFKVIGNFSNDELSKLLFGKTIVGETPIPNCKLIRLGVSIPFENLGLENFTVDDASRFEILSLSELIKYSLCNDYYITNDIHIPIDGIISDTRQKKLGYMLVETYKFHNKIIYVYRRVDFYNY